MNVFLLFTSLHIFTLVDTVSLWSLDDVGNKQVTCESNAEVEDNWGPLGVELCSRDTM